MSTLETLQDLLIKEYKLPREQVAPEALLASVGLDSLGMIEMMMQIEERFSITLPDDKPPAMGSVGDLAAYIDALISAKASGTASTTTAAMPVA